MFLASPDGLTAGQRAALHDGGFTAVIVVGGTAAVPDAVAADAAHATGTVSAAIRLAGATRYETSVQIARWVTAHGGLGMDHAVMATGANFPDALTAGPLAGRSHAAMLLADKPDAPAFRFAASYRGSVAAAIIAGGSTAVDDATAHAFAQALGLPLR